MPRPSEIPNDEHSAKEALKYFSEMAYSRSHKDYFQKAISILYGENFKVKMDLSQRMSFSCQLCSKDMNNEISVAQHYQSGAHQKNLDKSVREGKSMSYNINSKYHYRGNSSKDSENLQSMLRTSPVKPVGLQMVEEYEKTVGKYYYKCHLCAAHGKLEAMFKHVIGKKHTEKYIKCRVVLKNSILTANEMEFIRDSLAKIERRTSIKTYRDKTLYPVKWEKCISRQAVSIKKETNWSPPRAGQSPSISSPSCSSRLEKSPERYSSRSSSFTFLSSKHSLKRERETTPDKMFEDKFSQKRPREKSPLSMFRNRSPSTDNVAQTAGIDTGSIAFTSKQDVTTQDQGHQKFDLEELMVQLNYIVKTSHLSKFHICAPEDAKSALDMMFKISSAFHSIIKTKIEHSDDKSEQFLNNLTHRKNLLSKIMGSVKLRMEPGLRKHDT